MIVESYFIENDMDMDMALTEADGIEEM